MASSTAVACHILATWLPCCPFAAVTAATFVIATVVEFTLGS
jgi:hypothetical protein